MYYRFGDEGSIRLLTCTVLGVLILLLSLTSDAIIQKLGAICASVNLSRRQRAGTILRWYVHLHLVYPLLITTFHRGFYQMADKV